MPFELLWPLIELTAFDWYSVQFDRDPEFSGDPPAHFFHLGPMIHDFADTAAILKEMDLVITVETAVAHLAGALQVPTWIALSRLPAWRWHLDRTDNEWYRTVRLFRQDRLHDWPSVIAQMRSNLDDTLF